MNKRAKAKLAKARIREHARMAELLLPPTPENCPEYPLVYFESFRPKLFWACKNSKHKKCPKTVDQDRGRTHLYCNCPCHQPKMSRWKKRQLMDKLKKEMEKKERLRTPREHAAPRTPSVKSGKKRFRYVKAPDGHIPAGIMSIVHSAIRDMKEASVLELLDQTEAEIHKVSKQDPQTQTSIMLHRMLKAGVVEVV